MKTEVKTKDMLDYLQTEFTNWLREREKYGPDDRIVKKYEAQVMGLKVMIEWMIEAPVNLQKNGTVTVGF